jgi:hypothetical protein
VFGYREYHRGGQGGSYGLLKGTTLRKVGWHTGKALTMIKYDDFGRPCEPLDEFNLFRVVFLFNDLFVVEIVG